MVIKIIIFLAVTLALTIGVHLLFYRAVIQVFAISGPILKTSLLIILFMLAISFMVSFFLLQWQENRLTIGFYKFSAIWIGLFLHLLPAVLASWIIIATVRITGVNAPSRLIAAGCIVAAILYSAYGVWNAFHPRIKKLEVQFENLPNQWKNKTILHLSDVHLGHFYGTEFLSKLVRKVNTLDPELIFITGDLFDGMAATISHFAAGLDQLKAKKGVFFVTGNHETYIGLNRALNVLKTTKIKVLHNEIIELDGLQIVGIGYPGIRGAHEIQGLEKQPRIPPNNSPRILLFHTPTNIRPESGDGMDHHFATYWVPDTSFALNRELGVDLQLSGHSHAGQLFPFGYLTKLIYKGYDYGFHRLSRFAIYTTSGVGTWGPPMRTGNSPEIVVIDLK
jgi:predicted MPP superfamily phosphohydrolase